MEKGSEEYNAAGDLGPDFRNDFLKLLNNTKNKNIFVNFLETSRVEPLSIQLLITAAKKMKEEDRSIFFENIPEALGKKLNLMGLDEDGLNEAPSLNQEKPDDANPCNR